MFFVYLWGLFYFFQSCILAAIVVVASCEYKISETSYHSAPAYHKFPAAPAYHAPAQVYHDAHPVYKFSYAVHDPHTHDVKTQEESRDGHYVKGSYSLVEPDGGKRVVHYSDNGHGFEAVVHKEGGYQHAAPVYPAYPAYHAAPVYHAAPAYKS